mmetsp:Transcript_22750/g.32089  ORF Transcript_22750/g.32089 Transcript_22750/m.32089 type:complete len:87 (+) Transcript_22750:657-917(+)
MILSQIVYASPPSPRLPSGGSGAVKAKNGSAKFMNAFLYRLRDLFCSSFIISIHERAETNPVVVIIAGTMRPATRLVSMPSTGDIP